MAYKSIKVKNYSDVIEEYIAAAAITPGHLIELASATTVQVHSTVEGNVFIMFALEDELQGNGIDDAYEALDPVQCWIPNRGDIVYALLEDGQNASVGDFLESSGSGTLQVHVSETESWDQASGAGAITVPPNPIVGQAIEAVDLSDSANLTADGRILVRII